ncbi:MAG: tetratricopeptide repeat protein [Calditrichaeota bacterium]|nr:MAG: tetratricopeptide repeat protein [Calditrichota bacterium]
MALNYDWLENQIGTVDQLIQTPGPFSEKLVEWILRHRSIHGDAILSAALAWRRLEPSLLATLLRISEEQAKKISEELSRFSFVKYRPPDPNHHFAGAIQLHDEMRDMVLNYLWPREGFWTQRAVLEEVIAWYEDRIGDEQVLRGLSRPKTDDQRSLLTEYLYYKLSYDVREGAQLGEVLFKQASHFQDISLCIMINAEIDRFIDQLPDDRRDQFRFQQALVAFRQDEYDQAKELWEYLTRLPNCDEKLKATCYTLLVELDGYAGNFEKALKRAQKGEKIYLELLKQKDLDEHSKHKLKKELGQLYNNWGYIYRAQSKWDEALKYYHKAMEFHTSPKHKARTLNNIGFIYFQKKDIERAKTFVGQALQVRKNLGVAYELGLGYNTMGMILESQHRLDEAADLYRKARYHFEASHSDRGLALVNINLGRIMRITNNFDRALDYLMQAKQVLEQKNDTTYLIKALNEIGRAYREWGAPDNFEKAEKTLKESLDLCKNINDRKTEADTLNELSSLYFSWAKFLKQSDKTKFESFLNQVLTSSKKAFDVAEQEDKPFLKASVERTSGDIEFEKQDYDKAFEHFFKACEVLATSKEEVQSPFEYQFNLIRNADRLEERLHALPIPEKLKFTNILLEELNKKPDNVKENLKIVETKLKTTLQLNDNSLFPAPLGAE